MSIIKVHDRNFEPFISAKQIEARISAIDAGNYAGV